MITGNADLRGEDATRDEDEELKGAVRTAHAYYASAARAFLEGLRPAVEQMAVWRAEREVAERRECDRDRPGG